MLELTSLLDTLGSSTLLSFASLLLYNHSLSFSACSQAFRFCHNSRLVSTTPHCNHLQCRQRLFSWLL